MAEQSAGGAEFQVLNYGAIRSTERSVASTGARCRARSNPQETQSAKCGAPSQIGGLHGADKVERGAICVKQRMPSVEHGAIHDRCDRKVRGPATRPRRIVEANMLVIPPNVTYEDAAMTEPLACVMRGLHETGVEIGDTVTIIGGGPIGLMFVQVARAIGCNVISVVKRDEQVVAAKQMGAHEIVQTTKVQNVVEAVRALTPQKRGCDVVVEAVGRPEAWEWTVEMVRKGGTVNFFGGCASGSKVQLDTNRLHYSEITLKATFHHTPETVRRAFGLIAAKKIRPTDYITGEAPLSRLQQVLRHMLNRGGDIKTAIIPGH